MGALATLVECLFLGSLLVWPQSWGFYVGEVMFGFAALQIIALCFKGEQW